MECLGVLPVTSAAAPVAASDGTTVGLVGEALRDIARGGIAGAVAGIVVAGLGGRIVMRLAAIIVPMSSGSFTENGNRIGDITFSGSLGLLLFGGLLFGLSGGTVWVVVSPWIPGAGLRRAIFSMPIAVALTGFGLIDGRNPDFSILRHDVLIVAMLLALVALLGLTIALLDDWLDRKLPRTTPGHARAMSVYGTIAGLGAVLILPVVLGSYLVVGGTSDPPVLLGLALIGVGLATLAWWALRRTGRERPQSTLLIAGRAALLAAVVFGVLELAPEVAAALGTT
jgi:hypothetical protein